MRAWQGSLTCSRRSIQSVNPPVPEQSHSSLHGHYMVEVPVAPVGDGAHTLGTAGGTNHSMITQLQDKTSSSTRNELSRLLKQIKTSEVTGLMPARDDEQMRGFFPLSMQIPGCQPHPQRSFATLPRASCSPGHQSRFPEGTHSAQAGIQGRTQPSPQSLHPGNSDTQEGKLPFEFLLDVVQLLIRRK